MDTQRFREELLKRMSTRDIGDAVLASVLAAYDEVATGPEMRAADLVESLTQRNDLTFVLFGRLGRLAGSAGLDGHSVGFVRAGEDAPFVPKSGGSRPSFDDARKAGTIIGDGSLWRRLNADGLADPTRTDHPSNIAAYTTGDTLTSGIALVTTDRTIDDRQGSHTDFHILGPDELIDEILEVSREYPQVMMDGLRAVFPHVNVLQDHPVEVTAVVDYRAV